MITELFQQAKSLFAQERYVIIFRCSEGDFVVNKSYFGGQSPVRMWFQPQAARIWQLVDMIFPGGICTQHVSVPSKGLSFKTTMVVCTMPPDWQLRGESHLARHVVSLAVMEEKNPPHAALIRQACKDAEQMQQQAA